MKLTGKGSGSKYGDDAYVAPRPRGSMAAAGGSGGDGSSSRRLGEGSRRGKEGHGERSAAAGEQDRASAATGVWDRADSSGSSRCTLRAMHSFTPVPSLIHGPLLTHGRNGTEQI